MLPEPSQPASALADVQRRMAAAQPPGGGADARLLAVSKTKPASAVAALAAAGQRAFGENYVQEAAAKVAELAALGLEWHLIGPLQSNKCKLAADTFDWVQTVDRLRLVEMLARYRRGAPLNVLIQVNIDGEAGKSGCAPDEIDALAAAIAAQPTLRLRGLMAIPQPFDDRARRAESFRAMRHRFDQRAAVSLHIDTLSMGMSDDFELAIAHGATMVRVGSALFGARA